MPRTALQSCKQQVRMAKRCLWTLVGSVGDHIASVECLNIPVEYEANKKVWMTGQLFEQ